MTLSIPSAIKDFINNLYPHLGDSNTIDEKIEYILNREATKEALKDSKTITNAAGTNTGNQTLTVPSSAYFSIHNTGGASLTFTIGGISVSVAASASWAGYFNAFTSVTITATSTYNWSTGV